MNFLTKVFVKRVVQDGAKQEPSSADLDKKKMEDNPQNQNVSINGFNLENTSGNPQVEQNKAKLSNGEIIYPPVEPQTLKNGRFSRICNSFFKMSKCSQYCIYVALAIMLILIIALPIIFTRKPSHSNTYKLEINGIVLPLSFDIADINNHLTDVILKHNKMESHYSATNANLNYYQTSTNQNQIEFTVPVMSFFQQLSNTRRQHTIYEGWLTQYNANPRAFIDKLVEDINNKMLEPHTYKDGQKIVDNLILQSVTEITQIDIIYSRENKKFAVLQYTINDANNLNKEAQKQAQDTKTKENSAGKQKDLAKAMENSIYYLKRVAFRNLQALRAKTAELVKAQKQNFGQTQITTEWQQALINECKTIEPFRFRCSLSAVEKLIPELTAEKLKVAGSNYVFTHALSIIFKQIEAKTA